MMGSEVQLVTVAEAARRLGVSIRTIHYFLHAKQIDSVKVGTRHRRISLQALEAFIKQGGLALAPGTEGEGR